MSDFDPQWITGVVLAGGRATRMGGEDKGLVGLAGKPMVEYVLQALRPQVGALVINANRNRQRYLAYRLPVVADTLEGFLGPLAGIAAAMQVAASELLVTAPCDSPFLPPDLVRRLFAARRAARADLAVVHDGQRLQPVFALLPTRLLSDLLAYLHSGERKIDRWYYRHRVAEVDFSDWPDTFLNVNTPEERVRIEARLRAG